MTDYEVLLYILQEVFDEGTASANANEDARLFQRDIATLHGLNELLDMLGELRVVMRADDNFQVRALEQLEEAR